MKKVCLFNFPKIEEFYQYSIDSLDPRPYFAEANSSRGANNLFLMLSNAESIDRMYREKNPSYMSFLHDFADKFKDADLVVLSTYNPIHPEVLYNDLKKPIKVLGFVDDPPSTYARGIPYLWAFDGAFYVSPSYNDHISFKDALERWGCEQSYWWPLVWPKPMNVSAKGSTPYGAASEHNYWWPLAQFFSPTNGQPEGFFANRDIDVIYVGRRYTSKMDRMIKLKKYFGARFRIYGEWDLRGYGGIVRGLFGKPILWAKVPSISEQERRDVYCRTKIGINMHFSDRPMETGNMRMYEIPAHGTMLLCDKAGLNAHEQIFEPDKEAVYYDSIEDAIEKIEYYLKHDEERERIARAGFARVHRDYDGESNLKRFLDWALALPKKREVTGNLTCLSA